MFGIEAFVEVSFRETVFGVAGTEAQVAEYNGDFDEDGEDE